MNRTRETALDHSLKLFSIPTMQAHAGTQPVLQVAEAFYQYMMLKDGPTPATVIKPSEEKE